MKTALAMVTLAGALLCTGCQPSWLSLYPPYEKGVTVLDAGLAGTWYGQIFEPSRVVFRTAGDSYEITVSTKTNGEWQETEQYDAFLLRMGDALFLDLSNSPGVAVRGHTLLKIQRNADTLEATSFRDEWLRDQLTKQAALTYLELPEGGLLITAPTRELRRFLLKHADDPDAFDTDPIEFRRGSR